MFDAIIRLALRHRWIVLLVAAALLVVGAVMTSRIPVDVLPELAAPSVTIVTEAGGLAPEEVEQLVTIPIEQAVSGARGVRRLRSSSAIGISLVWVDFDWDVDNRAARQIVTERLATAAGSLPSEVEPFMAPTSSIMGEVMFVGVVGTERATPAEVRTLAEWEVRRRLLGLRGVAQVVPIGGDVAQVVVTLQPDRLMQHRLSADVVLDALREVSRSRAGGFSVRGAQEYLVRVVGRADDLSELASIVVTHRDGVAVRLADVADVAFGAKVRRGAAAVNGIPAVVLKVQKQPHANTLEVTSTIESALDDVAQTLPEGVSLYRKGFRQADFIRVSINNVTLHLVEAAILVVLVLMLFLMSWRTTLISLLALPLSLVAGLVTLSWLGFSINTMTLGGLAIAIGELVDDAIIDVENVHRHLRDNHALPPGDRRPILDVVRDASQEVRSSIVFATMIIVLVFLPLFFLSGLEGRLLQPLGVAFVASIVASLLVALTVTPVLCYFLLGRGDVGAHVKEARFTAWLKNAYRQILRRLIRHPRLVGALSLAGAALATFALVTFGRTFLPAFNEGSLNIAAATAPGTSLEATEAIVGRLERYLVDHPAVSSVIRTTGRAERDEHALDVNFSELEVGLDLSAGEREEIFADVRQHASEIPGLVVTVGQPISHRIEHMVSGSRASLVVKVFGPELSELRRLARQAEAAVGTVEGVVDLSVEQQTVIPTIAIQPRHDELAAFGLTPGKLTEMVEMSLAGEELATYWRNHRPVPIVARLPHVYRNDPTLLTQLPVDRQAERYARLGDLCTIDKTLGPNLINHENSQRRIFITANVSGRDLKGAAEEVERTVRSSVVLPAGYHVELGGEFEQQASASRTIIGLSGVAVFGIAALLFVAFRSARDVMLVMLNLPLSLVGGVAAVALGDGILSIASMVGFIALFGIASRNGIMMVSHYRDLLTEGPSRAAETIITGSVDRLVPILMTALTAALALIPIALASGDPGGEIQGPMATVILGGLLSSTMLNLLVVPPLYAALSK